MKRARIWVAAAAALASALPALADESAARPEVVVLLHGLWRSPGSMELLADRLTAAGYEVHNLDYPSTQLAPAELGSWLDYELAACCAEAARLDFVTHSLGGLLVRAYLSEHAPPNLGRVVMLAPPNHGSELVDTFGTWIFARALLGPTALELGTGAGSLPNRLPPATYDVGVIAGTLSLSPVGSFVVPGESDGTVSVASTRLDGMRDFALVHTSHTFIMRSPEVAAMTIEFLRAGRFHALATQ